MTFTVSLDAFHCAMYALARHRTVDTSFQPVCHSCMRVWLLPPCGSAPAQAPFAILRASLTSRDGLVNR
eukprot:1812953-Pleurochrysis_carterae.AAC.1